MTKLDHTQDTLLAPIVRGYESSYIKMANNRSIFLSEDITNKVGSELSSLLLYYDHLDQNAPINLYIHSNGGDISGLNNIYDVMQMINAPISTILLGKCYSAGAIILSSGAAGMRYALESSKVMIHGVQFIFPIPGDDMINAKNYLEYIEDNNDLILKILSKHTGQSLEKIRKDCEREYWLDAKEAKSYGLIDHIITP